MEKIKLYDDTELEIVSISENNGVLRLSFENVNFDELRTVLNKPNNLSFIQVLTEGGAVCRAFDGYGEVEEYTTIENVITGDNVITVKIVKVNKVLEKLKEITETVDYLLLAQLESEV